jgi:hypothetical protein
MKVSLSLEAEWDRAAESGSQIDNARSFVGRILTQNRYPLLLNGLFLAEFSPKRDSAIANAGTAGPMVPFCPGLRPNPLK